MIPPSPSPPVWAACKGQQGGKSLGSSQVVLSVHPALGGHVLLDSLEHVRAFESPYAPKQFIPQLSSQVLVSFVPTVTFCPRWQHAPLFTFRCFRETPLCTATFPSSWVRWDKGRPTHQSYWESPGSSGQTGFQGHKVHSAPSGTTYPHQWYRLQVPKPLLTREEGVEKELDKCHQAVLLHFSHLLWLKHSLGCCKLCIIFQIFNKLFQQFWLGSSHPPLQCLYGGSEAL